MLNKYFNLLGQYAPNQEVNLVKGWVAEAIQQQGMDIYYIPRQDVKVDKIFGEDTQSAFSTNYKIECLMETVQAFDGPGDVLKQMQSIVGDQCTIQMQRDRFQQVTGMEFPREGDVIFFPGMLNKGVWDIKFVEDEQQFYPLGSKISFKLKLELFQVAGERFNTGIVDLDTRMQEMAPEQLQTLDNLEDVLVVDNKQVQRESDVIVDDTQKGIWGKF